MIIALIGLKRGGTKKMSNDISTMYTKDQNTKAGRKGYYAWKNVKEVVISPASYGDYILNKRSNKRKKRLGGIIK